jgi:hypothetical protein
MGQNQETSMDRSTDVNGTDDDRLAKIARNGKQNAPNKLDGPQKIGAKVVTMNVTGEQAHKIQNMVL